MKTKIEYSVDLKDVPQKVKAIFLETTEELRKLSAYVEALSSDLEYENVSNIVSRIERLRRRLYSVDNALEDSNNAIQGYAISVSQIQEQQAQATSPPKQPQEELDA